MDSDTLYVLATGISIVSIVVVFVAKYWFGKGDNDENAQGEDEEVNDQIAKGTFGRLPIVEWKQHKSALDQEYRDRFMETPNSPKADMDNDDKAPLLSSTDDDVVESVDAKAVTKVVRFQDVAGGEPQSDQNEDPDEINEKQIPISDEELQDILYSKMVDEDLAHLPGQLKSVKLRKATKQVEEGLTDEQKQEEAQVRSQQLESILTLMRQQEEKFGNSSMEDIEEQLKLYNL